MMQFLSRFFGSIRSFWKKHKSFAKYVLNELLGGAIYRMEDRVFDSAYNSIKESIALAWMVMEWIYNRMKNGESILSIKRDFPFMSEEDIRYAAYFYEQEKQEEKEE